jgi:peptide subunit release factor 1 (eRF1)
MISARDLDGLLAWKASEGQSILSLYLDRKTATGFWSAVDLTTVVKGLVKELEASVVEAERDALNNALQKAVAAATEGTWSGRCLIVFSPSGGGASWSRDLNVPVAALARWGPTPYLRPLLEAIGEYERYGVVLTDKMRARLFTIFLGEIEEERDAFNPEMVKRFASTGSDQARTMNLQRRSEEHARRHWKHVAAMLDRMERERRFDRLILGGPPEDVSELRRLIPKRLASRIAGVVNLPVEASANDVRKGTLEIELQAQRSRQEESIQELETAAAKENRAAAGLPRTLEALREGRVWRLLYADRLSLPGGECNDCGSLLEGPVERCPYCNGTTHPIEDLVGRMAERTAESGGRIEPVNGVLAERLKKIGGIGAFLRF